MVYKVKKKKNDIINKGKGTEIRMAFYYLIPKK